MIKFILPIYVEVIRSYLAFIQLPMDEDMISCSLIKIVVACDPFY